MKISRDIRRQILPGPLNLTQFKIHVQYLFWRVLHKYQDQFWNSRRIKMYEFCLPIVNSPQNKQGQKHEQKLITYSDTYTGLINRNKWNIGSPELQSVCKCKFNWNLISFWCINTSKCDSCKNWNKQNTFFSRLVCFWYSIFM